MTGQGSRDQPDPLALGRWARETPEAVALLAPGREPLCYRGLSNHLRDIQAALMQAGITRGEAVAVVLPNGPEFLTVFLALASVGACAPLDPALTEDEYRFYLSRLRAATVVLSDGASQPAADAARSLGIRILTIHAAAGRPAGVFEIVRNSEQPIAGTGRQTDAALLLFTSATTDSPKLVPLTWANLHAIAMHDSRALGLSATDRLLSLMPLFHLHGLAAALTQLSVGGSVVCPAKFEPENLPAWIKESQPTWLSSNPPLNRVILAAARRNPQAFRGCSLRFIRSGTAASEPELLTSLEEAIGVSVVNGYGMTETGGITREMQGRRKPGSVGQSSGLELAAVDSSGAFLPPGSEGEIVIRGPSVTAGYLDNPEANHQAFRNGWLHTGDLGRLDDEGFLFLTGRLKELINRGGKKISPQEVEAALLSHPEVAEAAACAIPHATLGEDVAAAVVLRAGAAASEPELRRFIATKLARFKVPRRIAVVSSIPLTSTGKPQRTHLAEKLHREPPGDSIPPARPPEPIESALVDIWRRILDVQQIDVTNDFFALGGDSLSAALMLTEVQREFGIDQGQFESSDFFDNPTVESLASIIAECGVNPDRVRAPANPDSRIISLRRSGASAPLFCFPASGPSPYYLRHLAKSLHRERPFFVVCHPEPVRDKRLLTLEEAAGEAVEGIRRERPHGPYVLAGHCYGGVVAFEAARQLMSQGERILALVLFDTSTPGHLGVRKHWKRYFAKAREMASALARGRLPVTAVELGRHLHMLGYIFARRSGGSASRAFAAVGSDLLVSGRQEKELNGMAMWEYTPREFTAPIIHFIAADHPVSAEVLTDPRLGWSDFARGGLEVRYVKGDHNSILLADNAPALALQLHEFLLLQDTGEPSRNVIGQAAGAH